MLTCTGRFLPEDFLSYNFIFSRFFFRAFFLLPDFPPFFLLSKKKLELCVSVQDTLPSVTFPKFGAKFCVFPVFLGKKKEENLEKGCSIRTALKGRGLRNAVVVASCCCSRL